MSIELPLRRAADHAIAYREAIATAARTPTRDYADRLAACSAPTPETGREAVAVIDELARLAEPGLRDRGPTLLRLGDRRLASRGCGLDRSRLTRRGPRPDIVSSNSSRRKTSSSRSPMLAPALAETAHPVAAHHLADARLPNIALAPSANASASPANPRRCAMPRPAAASPRAARARATFARRLHRPGTRSHASAGRPVISLRRSRAHHPAPLRAHHPARLRASGVVSHSASHRAR